MTTNSPPNNPLEFAQNLWGKMGFSLPGMVTPTFDVNELEKRLVDLKAVEGWLKMNLSMLQMTIQTLEMQCTTLNAVKQMSNIKPDLGSMPTLPFTKPTATKPTATKPIQRRNQISPPPNWVRIRPEGGRAQCWPPLKIVASFLFLCHLAE